MPKLKNMSKRIFNQEQIALLCSNKNVLRCSEKSITYHQKFKIWAISKYLEGLSPTAIFTEAGFNLATIGRETPKESLRRWLKIYRTKGEDSLKTDGRASNNPLGRPKVAKMAKMSDQEKMKYLEAQVAYLKAENAFLAKLRKQRLNYDQDKNMKSLNQ